MHAAKDASYLKPSPTITILCGCDHVRLNEICYTYMQEDSDHRSTIDHIFISDQLCNRLVKCCNMDSAIDFADHSPVMCTLTLPNIDYVLTEGAKASDRDGPVKSY